MPNYYSCYGEVKDPTLKHVVERSGIVSYTRDSAFLSYTFYYFAFLVPWKRGQSFELSRDTEILEERFISNGNGWITLQNDKQKHKFYVYEYAAEFFSEVRLRCD